MKSIIISFLFSVAYQAAEINKEFIKLIPNDTEVSFGQITWVKTSRSPSVIKIYNKDGTLRTVANIKYGSNGKLEVDYSDKFYKLILRVQSIYTKDNHGFEIYLDADNSSINDNELKGIEDKYKIDMIENLLDELSKRDSELDRYEDNDKSKL